MQLFDRTKPNRLVQESFASLRPGRVLDIGSFEGRNSLYLARLGWEVVAIDTNANALKAFEAVASQENLPVKTICADVNEFHPDDTFDAILCLMVLHFLPHDGILKLVCAIKDWTKSSGINLVSGFTDQNPPKTRPYLFKSQELKSLYDDWEVVHYEEAYGGGIMVPDKPEPQRYMGARLIARKP